MNRKHEYVIPVTLQYHLPENVINKFILPERAQLSVSANGWKLLKALFFERVVKIEANGDVKQQVFIPAENISLFAEELPSGIHINTLKPDSILFQLDENASKKVKVVLQTDLHLKKNYFITDSMQVEPDSIVLTGPKSIIQKYDFWETGIVKKENLANSLSGTVPLLKAADENINLSAIAVYYSVKIEKFRPKQFETYPAYETLSVPVSLYPKEKVIVNCKVSESSYDSITVDNILVTFGDIKNDTFFLQAPHETHFMKDIHITPSYFIRAK